MEQCSECKKRLKKGEEYICDKCLEKFEEYDEEKETDEDTDHASE